MKLSLIFEADFEKRSAKRTGGGKYIANMLRSGEISLDDVKAAAALGNQDAKEYMEIESGDISNWSRPNKIAKDIYSSDKLLKYIDALLNLASQSLLKIKAYTKKHWSELSELEREKVQDGLDAFYEAIVYLRNTDVPMSQQLEQDFDAYGAIFNWQYWSQITSNYGSGRIKGDYDTRKIGAETQYSDPKWLDVTTFRGSKPSKHDKELHPIMMIMGSLAETLDAIETLTQYDKFVQDRIDNPDANYTMTLDQVMINQIGRAIKGLAPIMGINTIQKRLMPIVAPSL